MRHGGVRLWELASKESPDLRERLQMPIKKLWYTIKIRWTLITIEIQQLASWLINANGYQIMDVIQYYTTSASKVDNLWQNRTQRSINIPTIQSVSSKWSVKEISDSTDLYIDKICIDTQGKITREGPWCCCPC